MNPLFQALKTPVDASLFSKDLADTKPKKNDRAALIAQQVLPALAMSEKERAAYEKESTAALKKLKNVERSRFSVSAKSTLDRIVFSASEKPLGERKVVVMFLPNFVLWEQILDKLSMLRDQCEVDVICCNYRGCGRSDGFAARDEYLVHDGVAQVLDLVKKGVKPENILLSGYSLGGAVALAVDEKLEEQKITVKAINERSFRSIQAFVEADPELLAQLDGVSIEDLGWGLRPEESIKKISGRVLVIHNDKDPMVTYPVSLKGALDKQKVKKKTISFIAMEPTKEKDQHNREWTSKEAKSIYAAIRDLLK